LIVYASTVVAYVGVFLAAAVEGEAVFVAASVAVAMGRLNAWGVLVAGAFGGAAGDQFFFYAFRGRLSSWLDRFPRLKPRRAALELLVRRFAVPLAASIRFLPGLRIAIPAACADAKMSPLLFSVLNLAGAFAWAGAILGLISWAGPTVLTRVGVGGRVAFAVPAIFVVLLFLALRRVKLGRTGSSS
jgi:membrane protein DedA with SNARE-associated domain